MQNLPLACAEDTALVAVARIPRRIHQHPARFVGQPGLDVRMIGLAGGRIVEGIPADAEGEGGERHGREAG